MCEELSVRDAGVRLMTTLTLCAGNAPKASQVCVFNKSFLLLFTAQVNVTAPVSYFTFQWCIEFTCGDLLSAFQLFLHFFVGAAPSAGVEMDIIVEKTCTVKEVC